jgi:DNA-binding PadR family transcriptional regulator
MADLRKNELAALGLVNREPMHGYRLNHAIQNMGLEHWTTLSRSSIYAALRRLAKRGAVSLTREREGQMPMRSVYHITAEGHELLREILREALGYVGPEDRYFYLGMAFAEALPIEEMLPLLEERVARLREATAHEREHVAESKSRFPEVHHIALMSEAGIRHAEVEIRFCEEVLELLRSNPDYFSRAEGGLHE